MNALSGGVGLGIPMLLNLWATPLLIFYLGKEAFGLSTLFTLLTGYLLVLDLYFPFVITQRIAWLRKKNDEGSIQLLQTRTFIYFFLAGLIGVSMLNIFAGTLASRVFQVRPDLVPVAELSLRLASFHFFGVLLSNWARSILYGRHNYVVPNFLNIVQFAITNLLGVYLVSQGGDVNDFLLVKTLSVAGIAVLLVFMVNPVISQVLSNLRKVFSFFKEVSFTIWNGVIFRSYELIFNRPELFVGIFLGTQDLTNFSVCFLVANSFYMLITKFIEVLYPTVTGLLSEGQNKKVKFILYRGSKAVWLIVILLALPILLLRVDFLQIWLGSSYSSVLDDLLLLMLLSTSLHSIFYKFFSYFVKAKGNFRLLSRYLLIRGGVAFILAMFLVDRFGLIGTGYAFLISNVFDVIFFAFLMRAEFHENPLRLFGYSFLRPLIFAGAIGFGFAYVRQYLPVNGWFSLGAIGILISLFFGGLLLVFGQIDRYFINYFKAFLFKK